MIIYDEVSISETFIPKNQPKFELKWVKNGHFYANFIIGVSADLAEYSVPNIRWVLAEYSAEYSVFGRTLSLTMLHNIEKGLIFCLVDLQNTK